MRQPPPPDVLVRIIAAGSPPTGIVLCGGRCIAAPKRYKHLIGKDREYIKGFFDAASLQAFIVKRHPDRRPYWRKQTRE